MAIRLPIVSTFDKKGLDRAKRALKNFSSFAADVGKIAAGAVTAVAVAGVREAAAFESSIAKIEGLVGVGGEQLDRLAQSARELGPEFGKSANEAADALFFITSAGLRGEGAINVLEASLKGAAIGLGDTKTIADLATSAVNAYGESNLDGAQAVDVLTEAVRLGKLEPAELAGAMGQVLPLASNLGVSFDQVGAALAGMSKTGTDASTASTQLRQILATIAKPTRMRLTGTLRRPRKCSVISVHCLVCWTLWVRLRRTTVKYLLSWLTVLVCWMRRSVLHRRRLSLSLIRQWGPRRKSCWVLVRI